METIESSLTSGAYLAELKRCCSSPFLLFDERVTGIVLGGFFSVAYYSPWEWNRRITGECNRAIGIVRETDGKTEIRFVRSRGMFSLFWLVFWMLFCAALCVLMTGQWEPIILPVSAAVSAVVCLISAFESSLTDNGQQGAWIITDLLRKPDEFYYC
ncbi:MAG: hypothetical protein J6C98_07135 [Oscillospiraceae bacterium]|nr:hypothetical protein [Oscillospiraceae bacterium]